MNRRSISLLLTWLVAGLAVGPGAVAQGVEKRLAIKGYDPVAYFTESRAAVGDARLEHEWDGAVYRFASARHLELFKADPERYLPQYAGLCTATMSRGAKLVGEPQHWLVLDGRLYLFGGPAGPDRMRADSVAMKARADENWAKTAQVPPPSLR